MHSTFYKLILRISFNTQATSAERSSPVVKHRVDELLVFCMVLARGEKCQSLEISSEHMLCSGNVANRASDACLRSPLARSVKPICVV